MFLAGAYPLLPPKIKFLTRIWHPNVDILGRVCLFTGDYRWSPAFQVNSCIRCTRLLLIYPNVEDPLNIECA